MNRTIEISKSADIKDSKGRKCGVSVQLRVENSPEGIPKLDGRREIRHVMISSTGGPVVHVDCPESLDMADVEFIADALSDIIKQC